MTLAMLNTSFSVSVCTPQFNCGNDSKAGVCQRTNNDAINIGSANNYPLYLDGDLTLVYSHGAPCPNKDVRDFYQSEIEFTCDIDADGLASAFSLSSCSVASMSFSAYPHTC